MRLAHLLAALTLVASSAACAQGVSNNNYENIEAEAKKAQEIADFSLEYQKHLEMKDSRAKTVRGAFSGEFKFKQSSCIMGGSSIGIGSATKQRNDAAQGGYDCDCPKGTKKLGCLVSAKSITRFAKEDMGGVGYVMLFADDGSDTSLLIDGKWQPFIAIKQGKPTYTVPVIKNIPYEYSIPFNRAMCGGGSGLSSMASAASGGSGIGKSYRILAGYGVADTMDLKYLENARQYGGTIDEKEFLWSSARLDGFRMHNARQIGVVTCD